MFPNGLVALWVFARSFESGDIRRSLWKSAVASIAGAGVGWFLGLWIGNSDTNRRNDLLKEMFLAFQLGVALFQAFVVSRLSGVFAGISSTDYEARFPAVQVSTIDGSSRDDLRLTKANGSEYRFVGPDGLEFLIPREHVRLVRRRLPD
jgi:hypothetical protein